MLRNLGFSERPDYQTIRTLLRTMLQRYILRDTILMEKAIGMEAPQTVLGKRKRCDSLTTNDST